MRRTNLYTAGIAACCSSCSSAFVFSALPRPCALSATSATSLVRIDPVTLAGRTAAHGTSNPSHSCSHSTGYTPLFAEGEKSEGGESQAPMDLDLEQMFEVFEAADKEVSDDTVGKKGDKKPAKDAGEAMGDMLSSLFGGNKK